MAHMKEPLTQAQIAKLSAANVRKEYNDLANTYRKVIDDELIRCVDCGEWMAKSNFYNSKKYKTGFFPVCKKCVLEKVEQRVKKNDKPNECKESVIEMMRDMDLPYIDSLYDSCCQSVIDDVNEKIKRSPFQQMLTAILSLPQYRNKTFKDSEFAIEDLGNSKKIKTSTLKRFGNFGFNEGDLLFLQNEYDQWVSRCECNTLAQETLFERISCKKLEIAKATKAGKDTKDLDKALQDLMNSANILPRQNSMDTLSEGQTLGTLIEKYENDRPIPEPDPDFKDIDNLGKYITVFFQGHLSKVLGLKNRFAKMYEDYMAQYTVNPPEYEEDEDAEDLFDKIFGNGA